MRKKLFIYFFVVLLMALVVTNDYLSITVYAEETNDNDQSVSSDDNTVQKLYNFIFSTIGAINKTSKDTNDTINGMPDSVVNKVKETIASACNGGGIYKDKNGDYVFSDDTLNQIYSNMQQNSSVDATVLTDFSNFSFFADEYVNSNYISKCDGYVAKARANYYTGNYITVTVRGHKGGNEVSTWLAVASLDDDFGYLCIEKYSDNNYQFMAYNKNGTLYNLKWLLTQCCYEVNNHRCLNFDCNPSSSALCTSYAGGACKIIGTNYDLMYNSGPCYNNVSNSFYQERHTDIVFDNVNIYSNRSIILAKTPNVGTDVVNNGFTTNYYQNFDTTKVYKKTIIENNDWTKIYNDYVTNVKNEYTSGMTDDEFRKIQKKFTNNIIKAIEDNVSDLDDTISEGNNYLKDISENVNIIKEKLLSKDSNVTKEDLQEFYTILNSIDEHTLSTSTDLAILKEEILQYIKDKNDGFEKIENLVTDIKCNQDTYYDYLCDLATISNQLDTVIAKMDTIQYNPKNPKVKVPTDWGDILDILRGVTEEDSDTLKATLEVVGNILQCAVPFAYITFIGGVISSLAVEPTKPPTFNIPFKNDRTNVDETLTIDMDFIESIRGALYAMETIVFIIGLIAFTFTIYNTFGSLFS